MQVTATFGGWAGPCVVIACGRSSQGDLPAPLKYVATPRCGLDPPETGDRRLGPQDVEAYP